jgi:hypothetical protein
MMKRGLAEKLGPMAALLLFCVFAVSVFTVLALGVGVYDKVAKNGGEGRSERMCLSYVWTKIKNADVAGRVYLSEIGGVPALCLEEDLGGRKFCTMIYHYGGSVRELFFEVGKEYSPESGVEIIKSGPLEFSELENGLIKATSGAESIYIMRRSA